MFQLISTITRPSVDVSFPRDAAELADFVPVFNAAVAANPHLISRNVSLSEDQLTFTATEVWDTIEAATAFWSDTVFLAPLIAYNDANGMVRSHQYTEI